MTYELAVLTWPLLWLASVLTPIAMARFRARGGESKERAALQTSKQRLSEAARALEQSDARKFHAQVAAALSVSVEAKLGEPISGLTQSELKARLVAHGLTDALVQGLCDVLAQCDFARFSSANVPIDDMQTLLARATHLRSDVMSFDAHGHRRPWHGGRMNSVATCRSPRTRRPRCDRTLACLCMLSVFPHAAHAESLQTIFRDGNAAFFTGKYPIASQHYQRLVDAGVRDADVYMNLGLAHAHAGELGPAILAFEQTLRLAAR